VLELKVIGFVCSPRVGGNTEVLVQEALSGSKGEGAEVEMVKVADLKISPCDGCATCSKTGTCHIKDDMQKIYAKLLEADGIILGTPVYFWSVSSQTKILMDRTYVVYYSGKLKNKAAGGIAVGNRRGTLNALSVIDSFFLGQGMRVAGLGVVGYALEKGAIRKDELAMKDAKELGKQVAQLCSSSK